MTSATNEHSDVGQRERSSLRSDSKSSTWMRLPPQVASFE